MVEIDNDVERVADLIVQSRRIVVFTGAGVSTESGIPDFRSPGGIWTRFQPEDFTIHKYLTSLKTRAKIWSMGREFKFQHAHPNAAHRAIVELEKMGKLLAVITQNIDNLHQRAGNRPDLVIELHGTMQELICTACLALETWEEVEWRVLAGEEDPRCTRCGGILKPNIVFFGEPLPLAVFEQAKEISRLCDLFMVVGSSLVVYPAADMPTHARRVGAKLVIINLSNTDQDHLADIVIRGRAGEMMSHIMQDVKKKINEGSTPNGEGG